MTTTTPFIQVLFRLCRATAKQTFLPFVFTWVLSVASGRAAAAGESLQILTGGYPRAFFFRSSEMMAASAGVTYEVWEKNFERLMGIEGKVLDEEIPGRFTRNLEFFTRFKRNHPGQLVLLHYNGNARSPLDHRKKYFAGHWLYFSGARILSDVPASGGETEIRVSDYPLQRQVPVRTTCVTALSAWKTALGGILRQKVPVGRKQSWRGPKSKFLSLTVAA